MSVRTVEREARATPDQFRAFLRWVDAAEIARMSEKNMRFSAVFGTPYGGGADDLFRRLRDQEGAVAERAGDPKYWLDAP